MAVAVHLGRFAVILAGLAIAPLLGVSGWFAGLFVNILCAVYAAILITIFGLWRSSGFTTPWRGRRAALLLLVPFAEAISWIFPNGLVDRDPGFLLWAASLLLVGFNEELVSRGVVLHLLSRRFTALPAVAITAALFGLQHLSLFATTGRGTFDILTNVAASACYGFALASYQHAFHWIWPLIFIHGLADFTTTHSAAPFDDWVTVVVSLLFIAYGFVILRVKRRMEQAGASQAVRET